MGGAPKMPAAPKAYPLPPPASPVDESVLEARKRAKSRLLSQQGRSSTILTGPQGATGGMVGTATLLGGGGGA
jgi:hypothetical protein